MDRQDALPHLGGGVLLRAAEVGRDDLGSLADEDLDGRLGHARTRARDHRHLPVQLAHHRSPVVSRHGREERANVIGEQLRLLHRGEVAAARHLGPVRDPVLTLDPRARKPQGLLGIARDPGRHVDEVRQPASGTRVLALPVEAHRGRDGPGHPVDGHVGEQLVTGERALGVTVAVAPAAELLDDPREQPGRRVVERRTERLRLRPLLERVRRLLDAEPLEGREVGVVVLAQLHRVVRWVGQRHVEVDARAVLGVRRPDPGRDLRTPVAALRAVAVVPEPRHQRDEGTGDPGDVPAARPRGLREAVARQRRRDDVERVLRLTAERLRGREPGDDVEELHDRARPPVGEEQRQRVGVLRSRVHEVDRLPVDRGAEVLELVEPGLLRAPVVVVAPGVDELAQVVDRDAVLPAGVLDLVRQARLFEPPPQVVQDGVVDLDVEALDAVVHRHQLGLVGIRRSATSPSSAAEPSYITSPCWRSTTESAIRSA